MGYSHLCEGYTCKKSEKKRFAKKEKDVGYEGNVKKDEILFI